MVVMELAGKVALVTGGSRGIGRAAAKLLSLAGADVAVGYRHAEAAAEATIAELKQGSGRAVAIAADLRYRAGCERLVDETLAVFSRLDLLVVSAGVWREAPIDGMTEAQLDDTLAINLKSAFFLCQLAVRAMRPRGTGNIILVGSTAGQRGEAFYSHYAASKAGLMGLTKSLAAEVGPLGIRVNCVAPGWVESDMTREVFDNPDRRASIRKETPLRRIAAPVDIAGPILFLASDLSSHVHGEVLNVNGGSVLCG